MDSFGTYTNTTQMALRYSIVNPSQCTIDPTASRRGTPAIKGSFGDSLFSRVIPDSTTIIVGFAFKVSNPASRNGDWIRFLDTSTRQVYVFYDSGTLTIKNAATAVIATASVAIEQNTWYFLEFKATISDSIPANSCVLKINGEVVATAPAGADCKGTANAFANRVSVGSGLSLSTAALFTIHDYYILDGTGSSFNDFIGDKKIEAGLVDGAGSHSDWTPSAGSNYQCVDEASWDGDTSYVSGDTAGQQDTYTFTNLPAGAPVVDAVQFNQVARKDDAGTRSIANAIVIGGTTYDGALVQSLGDSYGFFPEVITKNPATGANWTMAEVNAMEAGPKLVS